MEMALLGERDPATREEVSGSSATVLGACARGLLYLNWTMPVSAS